MWREVAVHVELRYAVRPLVAIVGLGLGIGAMLLRMVLGHGRRLTLLGIALGLVGVRGVEADAAGTVRRFDRSAHLPCGRRAAAAGRPVRLLASGQACDQDRIP
jgi:hypothetical protein